MKKFYLTLVTVLSVIQLTYAQWTTGTGTISTTNNVGIGTSTPAKQLVVLGTDNSAGINVLTSTYNDMVGIGYNTGGSISNGLTLYASSTVGNPILTAWGNGTVAIGLDYAAKQDAGTTAKNGLLVEGNVAIGTTNPQGYKLAVDGSVIATAVTVKVFLSWPDYVFKKDYQLPSLTTLKTYIDQNHHLPDMPSGQQVAKDGINLGELNKVLTKKVEELTLYLIEKDEQIKNDEEKLQAQNDRIEKLENAVNLLLKKKNNL